MTPAKAILEKELLELEKPGKIKPNRVIRFFPETCMSNGHQGLKAMAEKNGIKLSSLDRGEFLLFMNKSQTAVKLYTRGNLIAHYRGDHKIDIRTLTMLPRYFNGVDIDYRGAVKEVIEREFRRTK